MVGFVPSLIPLASVHTKQHIWTNAPDDGGRLLNQLRLWRIFQHAVVIAHPRNVFPRSAEQTFRYFFLGLSDLRLVLRCHVGIVRSLVFRSINDDIQLVLLSS